MCVKDNKGFLMEGFPTGGYDEEKPGPASKLLGG